MLDFACSPDVLGENEQLSLIALSVLFGLLLEAAYAFALLMQNGKQLLHYRGLVL
jgi:hypothetical protein